MENQETQNNLPVSLKLFKKYVFYEEVVDQLVKHNHQYAKGNKQEILQKFYESFYQRPAIRREIPIKFKPMPKSVRDKILQTPVGAEVDINANSVDETAEPISSMADSNSSKQKELPIVGDQTHAEKRCSKNSLDAENEAPNKRAKMDNVETKYHHNIAKYKFAKVKIPQTSQYVSMRHLCPVTLEDFQKYTNFIEIITQMCINHYGEVRKQKMDQATERYYLAQYFVPEQRHYKPLCFLEVKTNCPDDLRAKIFEFAKFNEQPVNVEAPNAAANKCNTLEAPSNSTSVVTSENANMNQLPLNVESAIAATTQFTTLAASKTSVVLQTLPTTSTNVELSNRPIVSQEQPASKTSAVKKIKIPQTSQFVRMTHLCPVTLEDFQKYTNIIEITTKMCINHYGEVRKHKIVQATERYYLAQYFVPEQRHYKPLCFLQVKTDCPDDLRAKIFEFAKFNEQPVNVKAPNAAANKCTTLEASNNSTSVHVTSENAHLNRSPLNIKSTIAPSIQFTNSAAFKTSQVLPTLPTTFANVELSNTPIASLEQPASKTSEVSQSLQKPPMDVKSLNAPTFNLEKNTSNTSVVPQSTQERCKTCAVIYPKFVEEIQEDSRHPNDEEYFRQLYKKLLMGDENVHKEIRFSLSFSTIFIKTQDAHTCANKLQSVWGLEEDKGPSCSKQRQSTFKMLRDEILRQFQLSNEIQMPVSFNIFKKCSFYDDTLKKILCDFCEPYMDLLDNFLNDEEVYNALLNYYYIQYFLNPTLREKYPVKLKMCPIRARNKMLSFVQTNVDSNSITGGLPDVSNSNCNNKTGTMNQTSNGASLPETSENLMPTSNPLAAIECTTSQSSLVSNNEKTQITSEDSQNKSNAPIRNHCPAEMNSEKVASASETNNVINKVSPVKSANQHKRKSSETSTEQIDKEEIMFKKPSTSTAGKAFIKLFDYKNTKKSEKMNAKRTKEQEAVNSLKPSSKEQTPVHNENKKFVLEQSNSQQINAVTPAVTIVDKVMPKPASDTKKDKPCSSKEQTPVHNENKKLVVEQSNSQQINAVTPAVTIVDKVMPKPYSDTKKDKPCSSKEQTPVHNDNKELVVEQSISQQINAVTPAAMIVDKVMPKPSSDTKKDKPCSSKEQTPVHNENKKLVVEQSNSQQINAVTPAVTIVDKVMPKPSSDTKQDKPCSSKEQTPVHNKNKELFVKQSNSLQINAVTPAVTIVDKVMPKPSSNTKKDQSCSSESSIKTQILMTTGERQTSQAEENLRLIKAQEIFFEPVDKTKSLHYLIRTTDGIRQRILQSILQLNLENFSRLTDIYEADELYNDPKLLNHCFEYVVKNPCVWPKNLFMRQPNLCKFLRKNGIALPEKAKMFEYISPKLVHWSDIIKYTDFSKHVRLEYFVRMGKRLDENTIDVECNSYYNRCWQQDNWLGKVPLLEETFWNMVFTEEDANKLNDLSLQTSSKDSETAKRHVAKPTRSQSTVEIIDVITLPQYVAHSARNDMQASVSTLNEVAVSSLSLDKPLSTAQDIAMVTLPQNVDYPKDALRTPILVPKNVAASTLPQDVADNSSQSLHVAISSINDDAVSILPPMVVVTPSRSLKATVSSIKDAALPTSSPKIADNPRHSLKATVSSIKDVAVPTLPPKVADNPRHSLKVTGLAVQNVAASTLSDNVADNPMVTIPLNVDDPKVALCTPIAVSKDVAVATLPQTIVDNRINALHWLCSIKHEAVSTLSPMVVDNPVLPLSHNVADNQRQTLHATISIPKENLVSILPPNILENSDASNVAVSALPQNVPDNSSQSLHAAGSATNLGKPQSNECVNILDSITNRLNKLRSNVAPTKRKLVSPKTVQYDDVEAMFAKMFAGDSSMEAASEMSSSDVHSNISTVLSPEYKLQYSNSSDDDVEFVPAIPSNVAVKQEPISFLRNEQIILRDSGGYEVLPCIDEVVDLDASSDLSNLLNETNNLLPSQIDFGDTTTEITERLIASNEIGSIEASSSGITINPGQRLPSSGASDDLVQGNQTPTMDMVHVIQSLNVNLESSGSPCNSPKNLENILQPFEMHADAADQETQLLDDGEACNARFQETQHFQSSQTLNEQSLATEPQHSQIISQYQTLNVPTTLPSNIFHERLNVINKHKTAKNQTNNRVTKNMPVPKAAIKSKRQLVKIQSIETVPQLTHALRSLPVVGMNVAATAAAVSNAKTATIQTVEVEAHGTPSEQAALRLSQALSNDNTLFNNTELLMATVDHNYASNTTTTTTAASDSSSNTLATTSKVITFSTTHSCCCPSLNEKSMKQRTLLYHNLKKFYFFRQLTPEHVAKYQLANLNYGKAYMEATISCGNFKTRISNHSLLTHLCSMWPASLRNDLLIILQDLEEFEFNSFQLSTEDLRHKVLHAFMLFASGFCHSHIMYREHDSEFSESKPICKCTVQHHKPYKSLTYALQPNILKRLAILKRNMKN